MAVSPLFDSYSPLDGAYDEYVDGKGRARASARSVMRLMDKLGRKAFRERHKLAADSFLQGGVTFTVYSDNQGAERIFPFDLVPRLVAGKEWQRIDNGLKQRVHTLNLFLNDVYGPQRILKEGIVPEALVLGSKGYLPQLRGITPPKGRYIHIGGIDLVRDGQGTYMVLEDNVRVPSGVSYVLENRTVMRKVFPRIFDLANPRPVDDYATELRNRLLSCAPERRGRKRLVVLTPGAYNSAYFEHSFLARRMGCDLVEGRDLFVEDDVVYASTTHGPERVDVIYRRVDDTFLDPEVFNKESMLGVPGLMRAYAAGNVTLANAPGNGVVDDKGIYPYVPDMIRFYLQEEPLLPQVPTYLCSRPEELSHVLDNLGELVVKSCNEAGGYGMLMGPRSTKKERGEFSRKLQADPRNFIAQPLLELSTCPTWTQRGLRPRRVDLRPYVISGGDDTWVLPGGLTRVALASGSYVVNSSQGGGSKDTWVLEDK